MSLPKEVKDQNCVMGCKNFTGGEVKHHKDCPFYPDSLSKYYDEMEGKLDGYANPIP